MMDDNELRKKAEKRAEEKVDFLVHFTIYVCVNSLLALVWYFNGGSAWIVGKGDIFPWFIFPLLGWGIGLAAHFFGVFATPNLKDHFAEKEYERMKRK